MDILSLIISLIGTGASVFALFTTVAVPPWLGVIVVIVGVLIVSTIIYAFIEHRKRRARRYATVRLGLEWIRLLYEVKEDNRVRVSYFEIRCNRLTNVARSPYGTRKTAITFTKGEGFAGACWQEYELSADRFILVSNLPTARGNQEALIREYEKRETRLKTEKILRFKPDIRSYLIVALTHPISRNIIGAVCLDSTRPYEFEASDDGDDSERIRLQETLKNVTDVVDTISRALYSK